MLQLQQARPYLLLALVARGTPQAMLQQLAKAHASTLIWVMRQLLSEYSVQHSTVGLGLRRSILFRGQLCLAQCIPHVSLSTQLARPTPC